MVYANPVSEAFATGSFYEERTESFYLSKDKLQADYDPVRFQREWYLFRHWVPQGKVLDVGCSTGGFLRGLKRFGDYELVGQDVSLGALEQASLEGIHVLRDSFLDLPDEPGSYDAITFWAVLEHVFDPFAFLSKASSLLTHSGICVLLVPNLHSLAMRCLGSRYRYVMAEHLNYFSAAALACLVERLGDWRVEQVTSTHFNPVVILQDAIKPRQEVPDAERARLLKRTNTWKRSRFLSPVKALYGGVESALSGIMAADNLVVVLRRDSGVRKRGQGLIPSSP
jgi:2-polyprenyl-3-methyl-5-hydroxy-6-metoxy-1,4-benzoquinol methylase